MDKICILFGSVLSIICGVSQPLVVYFFGKITGDIVDYAIVAYTPNITESELQQAADELQVETNSFAISLGAVGLGLLLFTYFGNTLFTYSALRQVGYRSSLISEHFLAYRFSKSNC